MTNNLKKIREKVGLTQKQVAEKLGMNHVQSYQSVEASSHQPSVDVAIKIAKILKTPVEKLWG